MFFAEKLVQSGIMEVDLTKMVIPTMNVRFRTTRAVSQRHGIALPHQSATVH